MQLFLQLLTASQILVIYIGEIIQHELKCAIYGFMFITIIRHVKSLQKKSKCIIHQLNGYYNSLFNANNLTLTVEKLQSILLNSALVPS